MGMNVSIRENSDTNLLTINLFHKLLRHPSKHITMKTVKNMGIKTEHNDMDTWEDCERDK